MKKLTLLFAALLLASTTLLAQNIDEVYYRCPVYNTVNDPTSGIKEWKTEMVEATVVENAVTWGTAGETTWYVVTGDVKIREAVICNGDVRLILGGKLTVNSDGSNAAIQVSGEGNSLTIYQQSYYDGTLIANGTLTATGGNRGAGIGGGWNGDGSYITINGGNVTATGGNSAAGIGGGDGGNGSNITINGGTVTATGGLNGVGIGGGYKGSGSYITLSVVNYRVKVGTTEGTTFIHYDSGDITGDLAGKSIVEIYPDGLLNDRNDAIETIETLVEGIANETIRAMAAKAVEDIFQAEGSENIIAAKEKALADLAYVLGFYNSGKAEAADEILGEMATQANGHAVVVSDGTTTVTLYNPLNVSFIKVEE